MLSRPPLQGLEGLVEAELRRLVFDYLNIECCDGSEVEMIHRPAALVRECHLRLIQTPGLEMSNHARFFELACHLLRCILVEEARAQEAHDLVAIHQALIRLDKVDPRKAQVVELRYYGGLSNREIAKVLDISEMTAQRDWMTARRWIRRRI